MENQLVKVINESGLDKTKAQVLLENFSNYFEIAADWENKAKSLVVTSVEQRAEMKMAREGRLFLKEKRVAVEKTRKALKENALREGQTIDAIAKILTNLILPIEEDLEGKERFAAIQEENRIEAMKQERDKELLPYIEYIPLGIDLSMSEEDYQKILTGAKLQLQARIDAEKKAEEDRIAREKAEAEEREAQRLENIRLKAEAEERERLAEIERKKQAKLLADQKAKADAERVKLEEKAQKEREEADRKLKAEQAEKAKLEAELKAKADAERKAEVDRLAKEEAEKKAKAYAEKAPDKQKLTAWIDGLSLSEITASTAAGKAVEGTIREKFTAFKTWAKSQINTI